MKVLVLIVLLAVSVHCDDTLHEHDPICRGRADGYKVQNLYDCSQFYQCIDGGSYLEDCPDNTLFNSNTLRCDFMENVTCVEPVDSSMPITYPICTGVENGSAFPHKTDATQYYVCEDNEVMDMICEPGLIFNADLEACDWVGQ